jgi:hypothetical protein
MLSAGLTFERAAKAIGVTCQMAYLWRRTDESFQRDWEEAVDISIDVVEAGLAESAMATPAHRSATIRLC